MAWLRGEGLGWCICRPVGVCAAPGPGALAGFIAAAPLLCHAMPDNPPVTHRLSIPSASGDLAPEAQPTVARRFNAGLADDVRSAPPGRLNQHRHGPQPSRRDLSDFLPNPALKRRAMLIPSLRDPHRDHAGGLARHGGHRPPLQLQTAATTKANYLIPAHPCFICVHLWLKRKN